MNLAAAKVPHRLPFVDDPGCNTLPPQPPVGREPSGYSAPPSRLRRFGMLVAHFIATVCLWWWFDAEFTVGEWCDQCRDVVEDHTTETCPNRITVFCLRCDGRTLLSPDNRCSICDEVEYREPHFRWSERA